MKLATRLSVISVAVLAVVLVGFSGTLYLFQRWALIRQAHEQMSTALKSLVASIEVEPDGVEWNPLEHQLNDYDNQPSWQVRDNMGAIIDQSLLFPALSEPPPAEPTAVDVGDSRSTATWWVASERVAVPEDAIPVDEPAASDGPDVDDVPEYPSLTVIVAMPTADVTSELNRLAVVLSLLSLAVVVIASIFGRALARRALRPITTMANATGGITAGSDARLPVPSSRDEVAELGEAINTLLDRLGAAFDRERRFTAEASHQLRTPVTAMLGQIDVTLRRDRSPDEYRQTLSAARDQADRLRRIVESLLTLARSEHGATTTPAETLDLAAWLTKHVETWTYRDGESNIRLAVDDPVETAVDTELLGPMLDVLIENAVKYSPPKAPVQIRLSNDRGRATIDVIDSGPGVPEAESGDIFRPFHRGDDAIRRGVPGLGLGLALAARIAERIGATLSFDRPADGGSRFRITL